MQDKPNDKALREGQKLTAEDKIMVQLMKSGLSWQESKKLFQEARDISPSIQGTNSKSAEEIEWTSENIIGRVKDRFKELRAKGWDWNGFYNGWLEGRVDMLRISQFQVKQETQKTGEIEKYRTMWLQAIETIYMLSDKLAEKDREIISADHFSRTTALENERLKSRIQELESNKGVDLGELRKEIYETYAKQFPTDELERGVMYGFEWTVEKLKLHLTPSPQPTVDVPKADIEDLRVRLLSMKDHGAREGCTYGDTKYDSPSACYGYNLAIDYIVEDLPKLLIGLSIRPSETVSSEVVDEMLLDFIDWFGTWQTNKNLNDFGINDILDAYKEFKNQQLTTNQLKDK